MDHDQHSPSSTGTGISGQGRAPRRVRHELRFRLIEVTGVERLSPHMARITFGGTDLDNFLSPGFDDHVKLLFPVDGEESPALPSFDGRAILFPEDRPRPVARDFTPRRYDRATGTLTIDFALHENGPATEWARAAIPGQKIGLGGPRGSFLFSPDFDWHLLVGDATALPAIARRLEELPADARAVALIEVESMADRLPLAAPDGAEIIWVCRDQTVPGASPLLSALDDLRLPDGDYFAWIACESAIAKRLRQVLVEGRGANPKWVRAAGYWRQGAAGTHDTFDE